MRFRIALWAAAGFAVVWCWRLYIFLTFPAPMTLADTVGMLARITCPVVLVGIYFHVPLGFYLVLLVNTATYAMVGLIVEVLRQRLHHAHQLKAAH